MKKNIIISVILIMFAVIFTILVKTVDVQDIGVNGTNIGFATINKNIFETVGVNDLLYKITNILGYISLGIVGIFAIVGLVQLIKRKSLFKVDKEIIALGGFYIIVLALYFIFDKIAINYRPILEDGKLEASYPSSHTLLAICVFLSAIWINKSLFKSDMTKIINILLMMMLVLTVLGRFLSGVHWFTDIIGGILISSALLMCFKTVLDYIDTKKDNGE